MPCPLIALALNLLPIPALADLVPTPEDLRGRYVSDQTCHADHPALEIEGEELRLGRTSCFPRAITRDDGSATFDLTACWAGGEVSGDRILVLNNLGSSRYEMTVETTQPLTRCPPN